MASKNKNILDSLKVGIRSFPKDIFLKRPSKVRPKNLTLGGVFYSQNSR